MASLYDTCAEVAERGGVWTFLQLADLDGNPLDAKEVQTRYGYSWMITHADGKVSWFSESQASNGARRAAANARKGYKFLDVEMEAVVITTGNGGRVAPKRGADVRIIGDAPSEDWS